MLLNLKILRILLASSIGAIYACIYYITNMKIYGEFILKIILSIAIVYISFRSKEIKEFLREILIFYLTSFTFGGVSFALLYFISPGNILFKAGAKLSAKASDANALDKNPANVIPI